MTLRGSACAASHCRNSTIAGDRLRIATRPGNPLWIPTSKPAVSMASVRTTAVRNSVILHPCRKIMVSDGGRSARIPHYGEMAEWSMAVVLKTTVPEKVPRVRTPLSET